MKTGPWELVDILATAVSNTQAGVEAIYFHFIIGEKGSLHYQFIDKLDPYEGLMLGFRVVNWKLHSGSFDYGSIAGSGIATAFYIGGR